MVDARQPRARRRSVLPTDGDAPHRTSGPDLAVLARPDGDRRSRRRVHPEPPQLRPDGGRSHRGRPDPVPLVDPGRDHLDPRAADGRLDQRLHRQPLGSTQAVHRHRLAAGPGVPGGHCPLQHRPDARGVRGTPGIQHEYRPRSVPGIRPRSRPREAGRSGERDGRPHAGARQRHRIRACHGRRRRLRPDRARHRGGRDRRTRHDDRRRRKGRRGPAAEAPGRQVVGEHRPRDVGDRRPPGTLLRVAADVTVLLSHGRGRPREPVHHVPQADARARSRTGPTRRTSSCWPRSP